MNHYLITRFNLRSRDWHHTRLGEEVLTENWLKKRFAIFEKYCLPSVINQSNQNFKWCVFFDVDTPGFYKKRIDRFKKQQSNFFPVYIEDMESLNRSLIAFIEKTITGFPFLITTRLDNDDILHRDFIETIQSQFKLQDDLVIDLTKGFQIQRKRHYSAIRTIDFPFNQFISYAETTTPPIRTVMDKQHQEWKRHHLVKSFSEKEMWIEFIHDTNKWNDVRSEFKRTACFNNKDFGISSSPEFKDRKFRVFCHNLKMDCIIFKNKIQKKIKSKLK